MNRTLTAVLAAAVLGLPAAAFAADAMAGSMMHASAGSMICRPAGAGEHGTAMMMASKTMLVCKAVTAKMMTGPDLSGALNPDQINAAWQKYLNTIIAVPVTGGG